MGGSAPLVSSALLARPDLQRALAEHDFATVFLLLRKYGGLSQNRIAAACGLTPGKVSRIVNGEHQVIAYEVIARIADGLRVPGRMLGLAERPWETATPEETSTADSVSAPAATASWSPATAREIAPHDEEGPVHGPTRCFPVTRVGDHRRSPP